MQVIREIRLFGGVGRIMVGSWVVHIDAVSMLEARVRRATILSSLSYCGPTDFTIRVIRVSRIIMRYWGVKYLGVLNVFTHSPP